MHALPMAASAAILLIPGTLHLLYTLHGPKLTPRDPALREAMERVPPVLTRDTTMWKASKGCNASHSMGAMLFGVVYGYLALFAPQMPFSSRFLPLVGFLMLGGLAVLGRLYWFRIPFAGISISLACYIASVALAWSLDLRRARRAAPALPGYCPKGLAARYNSPGRACRMSSGANGAGVPWIRQSGRRLPATGRYAGCAYPFRKTTRGGHMRFVRTISTILLGAAMATSAMAQTAVTDITRAPGKVSATRTASTSAVITALDPAKRGVTLKAADGEEVAITASPEIRNYDKLKVGDTIDMSYIERLDLELIKGGGLKVERTEGGAEARAAEGEAPAGLIAAEVTTIGDVTAINAETQEVTLKGPERTVTIKVEDPEQFKLIAVGDQIKATATAAIGIAATPGAPAAN